MRLKLVRIVSSSAAGVPVRKRVSSPDLLRSALRILRNNVLCSLATVDHNNRAHINTAYFCYSPELGIYFLSHPASVHCQNLANNPSIAVTVFSSSQMWGKADSGLQLFGECHETKAGEIKKVERLYAKRFPAFGSWKANITDNEPAREYRFYSFMPNRMKLLDEKKHGDGILVSALIRRVP